MLFFDGKFKKSWERQQKNRHSMSWSAGNRFKSRVSAQTDSIYFQPSIAAVVQIDHFRRRTCIRVALKYYTTANCSSRFNLHRKQRTSGPSRCVKIWNAKLREEANLKIYFFFYNHKIVKQNTHEQKNRKIPLKYKHTHMQTHTTCFLFSRTER